MTTSNIARAVAFTTLALTSTTFPASAADPRLIFLCNAFGPPCVYDAQNLPVGLATGGGQGDEYSILQRPLNGTWYRVLYEQSQGFAQTAAETDVFFANSNCPAAGPAYVLPNPLGDPPIQVPQFLAEYDPTRNVLWGATSATVQHNVQFASRLFLDFSKSPVVTACTNGAGTIPDVLPAKIVDPAPPAGPFSIR